METDSPVVYHGTSESRFPPENTQKVRTQMTQEEIRVLRECNRESFYYRCVPYALAGMTATFLACKQGYLKSHPRWGPAGKMTGAAFLGWVLGKFSYRKACEEKFLKLENSAIADAVRRKMGYSLETFDGDSRYQKQQEDDLSIKDNYNTYKNDDYHSSSGSLNLDVDKNVPYSGLDDRDRPSTDREEYDFREENQPMRTFTTYEEMRRRNREDFERQNRPPSNRYSPPQGPTNSRRWGESEDHNRSNNRNPSEGSTRNSYGDSWDNTKSS